VKLLARRQSGCAPDRSSKLSPWQTDQAGIDGI
jgi:hypothetical protein